jgi:hypothetical protein
MVFYLKFYMDKVNLTKFRPLIFQHFSFPFNSGPIFCNHSLEVLSEVSVCLGNSIFKRQRVILALFFHLLDPCLVCDYIN